MKIFVTGATGFIGSHFVEHALRSEHTVVALRRSLTSRPRIQLTREPIWLTKSMAELTPEDFDACDCVVHLAAHNVHPPSDSLENCLYWNLTVPLAMIRHGHHAGVSRFVLAGSCFEYGRAGERFDCIPTDAPLEPITSYATSKAAASVAFGYLALELSLLLSIHRIFHVFGEGESENRFWPALRKAALSGEDFRMTTGEQVRDFIPVDFVASRLLDELSASDIVPGVCSIRNLGTGCPQSLRSFAEHWWKVWNAPGKLDIGAIPHRANEIMRFVPKIESIRSANPS